MSVVHLASALAPYSRSQYEGSVWLGLQGKLALRFQASAFNAL